MAVAEFCGRTTFLSLKDAIEVAHVVITALKTDFGNGLGGVYQHARGISHAYIDDVIAEPAACV